MQQQANQAQAAYNQQKDIFKRGFSACMDARGARREDALYLRPIDFQDQLETQKTFSGATRLSAV